MATERRAAWGSRTLGSPRLKNWRDNLQRASRGGRLLCAVLVTASLCLQPLTRAQEVAESAKNVDAFAISDVVPSVPSAANSLDAKNAAKERTVPVSASGSFSRAIAVDHPPGRLGMTPQLALAYDSSAAHRDSVVGAGWSFGTKRLSRSTRDGFPALKSVAGQAQYDDERAAFEAGGELLTLLG
jgi:Salmonella virulence plasmid 65kDa B protein